MSRPLSQLVYEPFQEASSGPRIVTLHDFSAFGGSMRELGLAVGGDGAVIGLQSAKGVHSGRTIVGYTWFIGPLHQTSPIHFGESLADVERFLWDEVERQEGVEATLPVLVGRGQGAAMALATAAAVPDLLSGVVAIDPVFPIIPGWEPPLAQLDGLPTLLVNAGENRGIQGLVSGEAELRTLFDRWGGNTTTIDGASSDDALPLASIRTWIASQPVRTLRDTV